MANDVSYSGTLNLQWATLSEYFAAQDSSGDAFPSIGPGYDFVPYNAADLQNFWTGYYTSRPVLKGLVRGVHAELQAAERLFTLAHTVAPQGACVLWAQFQRHFL